jgi:alpha-D-xyloside xylohydrolase
MGSKLEKIWVAAVLAGALAGTAGAQRPGVVLDRDGSTIALEPYGANIIRITLSLIKDAALAAPGYGFLAQPSDTDWRHQSTGDADVYRSSRLIVSVPVNRPRPRLPTQVAISKYFHGSNPPAHITISTPAGKTLLEMTSWWMAVPNYKNDDAGILRDRRPSDPAFYHVGAIFRSPNDEHYYGLGQNQEGFLDHRGHTVECWHNYLATGGPSICVPFVVTNYGYAMVWDNPSKTTIRPGFNERVQWDSEVGDRVSFFLIAGDNTDEIYSGDRLLTGATPMLPKAAYGYIQSKQRYSSQAEVLAVAEGYRDRHLPADMIVVDWFYYTKMGQMDFAPDAWPDPAAMNRQLHDLGFQSMISVWPRFTPDSRYYDFLKNKGWFEHLADGTPTDGQPYDLAGSDIDTTDPDAARWYWATIRDNILGRGFDAIWADETEPDLPPDGSYFHAGPGAQLFNIYPLTHTAALYDGFRRDIKHRALILARDAYLGSQRNATIVWSSDIFPTWDTLKRQIPAGLDFAASGFAYWTNDIGGWQYLPAEHHPAHPPLLDPSDARANVGGYDDYPELYTRWFEYATFLPVFRTHGSRNFNEVWSYGKAAEPILEKYLKLRYQLMPYIYSLAHCSYESGAPFMRALFMDFPNDPKVAELGDEYMFGPAFLVAPVTDQGASSRVVYLPSGADWYNYWTDERIHGGQTLRVEAPIDTLPLFVRAGSIVPLGEPIESTKQTQKLAKIRVYPGADGDLTLYNDDGLTYAYEKGESSITHLHWNEAAQKLESSGAPAWTKPDSAIVQLVGH